MDWQGNLILFAFVIVQRLLIVRYSFIGNTFFFFKYQICSGIFNRILIPYIIIFRTFNSSLTLKSSEEKTDDMVRETYWSQITFDTSGGSFNKPFWFCTDCRVVVVSTFHPDPHSCGVFLKVQQRFSRQNRKYRTCKWLTLIKTT